MRSGRWRKYRECKMTKPDTGGSVVADLRLCGVCWAGKNGVRMHYCDLPLGHGKDGKDHRCHCGEVLKIPAKLAGK